MITVAATHPSPELPAAVPTSCSGDPHRVQLRHRSGAPAPIACPGAVPGWDVFGIDGFGTATHLGENAFVSVSFAEPGTPPGVPSGHNVCSTITAGNGDELFLETTGTAVLDPVTLTDVSGSGTWEWVGGTGRFVNASGSRTYEFVFSFVTGQGFPDTGRHDLALKAVAKPAFDGRAGSSGASTEATIPRTSAIRRPR